MRQNRFKCCNLDDLINVFLIIETRNGLLVTTSPKSRIVSFVFTVLWWWRWRRRRRRRRRRRWWWWLRFHFLHIHFLENWQKINTDPVCFKAKGDQYGVFNITKSGLLETMKLVYKNGSISCNQNDPTSYWGCRYQSYKGKELMTIITNKRKEAILPSAKELKKPNGYVCNKPHAYSLYMEQATHLQSSFSAIFPKRCLCHTIKRCRYGTDRIGSTVLKTTIVAKHALMCMRGMFKIMSLGLIWNR